MAINLVGVPGRQLTGLKMRRAAADGSSPRPRRTRLMELTRRLRRVEAGVVGLVRTAAMEPAPRDPVNAVAPGLIVTDLTREMAEDPDRARTYLRQIPAGRFGSPRDVAGAVAFLVSADATWITGHVLVVDGGQTLGTPSP
jgi:hypothetical protein